MLSEDFFLWYMNYISIKLFKKGNDQYKLFNSQNELEMKFQSHLLKLGAISYTFYK